MLDGRAKQLFEERAAVEKARYKQELEDWTNKKLNFVPEVTESSSSDDEPLPDKESLSKKMDQSLISSMIIGQSVPKRAIASAVKAAPVTPRGADTPKQTNCRTITVPDKFISELSCSLGDAEQTSRPTRALWLQHIQDNVAPLMPDGIPPYAADVFQPLPLSLFDGHGLFSNQSIPNGWNQSRFEEDTQHNQHLSYPQKDVHMSTSSVNRISPESMQVKTSTSGRDLSFWPVNTRASDELSDVSSLSAEEDDTGFLDEDLDVDMLLSNINTNDDNEASIVPVSHIL